jgi:hypothetical protein
MPHYQNDLTKIAAYVQKARANAAEALCKGAWSGEPKARELVGKFQAYDDIFQEMNKASGSDDSTEKDL